MEEVNQSVAISVVNDVRKRTTALVISLKKTSSGKMFVLWEVFSPGKKLAAEGS